jgi:SAM-dependent methyltransferase
MMPQATHDEQALESFLVDMRLHLMETMDPQDRALCNEWVAPRLEEKTGVRPTQSAEVREMLEAHPYHQVWLTLQRLYQDMLWQTIGESVDRQYDSLETARAAASGNPRGSLTLDPNVHVPRYLGAFDHHRMAGSYHRESRDDDFRPGALYDRYTTTYHVWRNGGWKNDGRGHTIASHVVSAYPDLKIDRLLDMGCSVGHSTTALKEDFPDAEVHAIDIAAPMLRYAHARAEHVGVPIHFSQQNAEATDFPDGHFDLVVSAVTLHETSLSATKNIFRECHRLLRKGGVMVHLEVPARYDQLGLWEQVRADFESHYNNEPFMAGVGRLDFADVAREAGFEKDQIMNGFRDFTPELTRLDMELRQVADPQGRLAMGSWFVCSAVR